MEGTRLFRSTRLAVRLIAITGISLMGAGGAPASTVARVTVGEMLAVCELVFEGRVVESWAEEIPGGIRTWVRFEVLDVVKGPALGPTLDLAFLGGRIDDRIDEIVGLRVPEQDEHGIYFVESLRRLQANPLYGWDQGRLIVRRDARGRERVVSARGRSVVGLEAGTRRPATAELTTGSGPASGVETDPDAQLEAALTPAAVKAALSAALGAAR